MKPVGGSQCAGHIRIPRTSIIGCIPKEEISYVAGKVGP